MLYAYRASEEQFESLRSYLDETYSGYTLDSTYHDGDFARLFVFYAAEWWRRKYDGGAWRWTPIIESIGCDADCFAHASRAHAVVMGLAYWGHRPAGEGKKYFGAIVAHGGLPLAFIGKGAGKIATILADSLKFAARYGWDEAMLMSAVEERSELVPDSLRRAEIYKLIAQMVVAALELRNEYELHGIEDPVKHLDTQEPHWQERFPLSLEDDAARTLLVGLVKQASKEEAHEQIGIFAVERSLREVEPGTFQLSSALVCPQSVAAENIKSMFGIVQQKELPRYFSIDVQTKIREPFAEARQVLGGESAKLNLAGRKRIWESDDALAEHRLFIRSTQPGLPDSPISLPGGQDLDIAEPWIFVFRDSKYFLVATGSARVPEETALITVPEGWSLLTNKAEGKAERVGSVTLVVAKLDLWQVAGDVRIDSGEFSYRIRTRQTKVEADSYAWEGSRLPYFSKPSAIFRGVPKLYRYLPSGQRQRVPPAQMEWYVSGTKRRVEDSNLARGPVDVFVVNDGERTARFRIIVLDSRAAVDFLSGKSPSIGAMQFSDWGFSDFSIAEQANLRAETRQDGRNVFLKVSSGDIPPESISVSAKWPFSNTELTLSLPFPSSGGRFFRADGTALKNGDHIPLRGLAGARLRIFDNNPSSPNRYDVELTLHSPNLSPRAIPLRLEEVVQLAEGSVGEVRLIDLRQKIETLLGFSDDLDASVDISLLVAKKSSLTIRVLRYEATVELTPAAIQIPSHEEQPSENAAHDSIVVCAVPLRSIGDEPCLLTQNYSEGVPTGYWPFTNLPNRAGPSLVFPGKASKVTFRPTVVPGVETVSSADPLDNNLCGLAKAISISDKSFREEEIRRVLNDMSADFSHASWPLIDHLYVAFCHLPLSGLDLFRVLSTEPGAAAAFILRTELIDEQRAEVGQRLKNEGGLVWELVSIEEWRHALHALWYYWRNTLGESARETFSIVLEQRTNKVSEEQPVLKLTLEFLKNEMLGIPSADLLEVIRQSAKDPLHFSDRLWRGEESLVQLYLFHGHSHESNWPDKHFLRTALEAFNETAAAKANEQKRDLQKALQKMFWGLGLNDHKLSVVNLPVLCALWVALSASTGWWQQPENRLMLRRIKGFDPLWFETAFRNTFASCLALNLVKTRPSVLLASNERAA